MNWTIIFRSSSGDYIGVVKSDGLNLQVDPPLYGIAAGHTPESFLERYEDWSNGYVTSRIDGKPAPEPVPPLTIPNRKRTDTIMKQHVEGVVWFENDTIADMPPDVEDPEE